MDLLYVVDGRGAGEAPAAPGSEVAQGRAPDLRATGPAESACSSRLHSRHSAQGGSTRRKERKSRTGGEGRGNVRSDGGTVR